MKQIVKNTPDYEIQLLPRAQYHVKQTQMSPAIGFAYEIQHGHHAFGSDRITPFYSIPNTLAFTPEGCDIYSESEEGGEYLLIRLKESALQAASTMHHQFNDHIDPQAINAAQALRKILISGNGERLQLDIEIHRLEEAVIRKMTTPTNLNHKTNSITTRRLRTLHDYIENNLSEEISLNCLAKTIGLSKSYFLRAFKAATGQQPHKYLVSRRIARAKQLIEQNRMKLTQISLACGFSSHAHMTTTFKKQLGVTPKTYRNIILK